MENVISDGTVDNKIFTFKIVSHPTKLIFKPAKPHYYSWVDVLGSKSKSTESTYTLEEILRLENKLSATQLGRIKSLKEGGHLKLHRISSQDVLYLVRLNNDKINEIDKISNEIQAIKKEIERHIPKQTLEHLDTLEIKLKKLLEGI